VSLNGRIDLDNDVRIRNVTHATRARSVGWIGRNSGHIFRRLWTKVHQIYSAYAGEFAVCNAVFRLMISCFDSKIWRLSCEVVRILSKIGVLLAAIFFWGDGPKFLTQSYKFGSSSNMVTIDRATSKIRRRKKRNQRQD